jgi:DNA-binding MarR family transcriptional regulator
LLPNGSKLNQTVELVKLWGAYEEQHPHASLDDFFRHQLSISKEEKTAAEEGQLVPDINGQLVILIRKIGKFHIMYSNMALAGSGLDQIEEFGILVIIHNRTNPIKSEVIYDNLLELSSGTNMLIRLKKRGLISEYSDKEDKRVKRLKLTAKGEETLKKAKVEVLRVAGMMVHSLTEYDKQLCIQMLNPIHNKFSAVFQKQKNKTFEEVYQENVNA